VSPMTTNSSITSLWRVEGSKRQSLPEKSVTQRIEKDKLSEYKTTDHLKH
jgi:hypothetical protein